MTRVATGAISRSGVVAAVRGAGRLVGGAGLPMQPAIKRNAGRRDALSPRLAGRPGRRRWMRIFGRPRNRRSRCAAWRCGGATQLPPRACHAIHTPASRLATLADGRLRLLTDLVVAYVSQGSSATAIKPRALPPIQQQQSAQPTAGFAGASRSSLLGGRVGGTVAPSLDDLAVPSVTPASRCCGAGARYTSPSYTRCDARTTTRSRAAAQPRAPATARTQPTRTRSRRLLAGFSPPTRC